MKCRICFGFENRLCDFREKFLNRQVDKEYISIEEARNQKFKIDWENEIIPEPKQLGIQIIENQA
jgi:5-methyltetrahydrofolate--homocysteine methyltransferase